MRDLTDFELENVGFLTRHGIDYGLLEPTGTGLGKSILDATDEYRAFLGRQGIHNFDTQGQGGNAKKTLPAHILLPDGRVIEAPATVYRPNSKNGDPRVWFSKLRRYCSPNDILVSLWSEERVWVLNATQVQFSKAATALPIYRSVLQPLVSEREAVFNELLEMLQGLSARGFIPTIKQGDTAVGHLLETELGIKANSRKIPDYKGVELKSTRAKKPTLLSMFGRVPDWDISTLKSSQQILDQFGYLRGNDRQLFCTVSAKNWNSQGLRLEVDEEAVLLHETSNRDDVPNVASWRLQRLYDALESKHADTFWIKAESCRDSAGESIHFQTVVQTTRPILQQFAPMLSAGSITVDHLISRRGTRVREQGPLFRINQSHFHQLFPHPIFHDLRANMTPAAGTGCAPEDEREAGR